MKSPTLLLMRMNAAETSASSAIADCTPLAVVWRSCTTAEIDTFISDVSTTSTNIAIAKSSGRRELPDPSSGLLGAGSDVTSLLTIGHGNGCAGYDLRTEGAGPRSRSIGGARGSTGSRRPGSCLGSASERRRATMIAW